MDQKDTKINKVMNFGDSSHKTVEMPDCFRLFGPKRAPLSRNRVNSEFYNDFETFSKLVENENVTTNKILGSLEILAIKNAFFRGIAC